MHKDGEGEGILIMPHSCRLPVFRAVHQVPADSNFEFLILLIHWRTSPVSEKRDCTTVGAAAASLSHPMCEGGD